MTTKAHKLAWPDEMIKRFGGALVPEAEEEFNVVYRECQSLQITEEVLQGLYSIYLQVAAWLVLTLDVRNGTRLIGINGAQGTGKTTAAVILKQILEICHGLKVCVLSMDDIYHTREQRAVLAREVHPLLITRGVPGTHDLNLGLELIDSLKNADQNSRTRIPVFDKANDDRVREEQWPVFDGRPDIILIEGWCVSAKPQPVERLLQPINELERLQDHDGVWRSFVNQQLENYQLLFNQIEFLIMLKAPGFRQIFEWRSLQEQKLKKSVDVDQARALMDEEQIKRFIEHFERITRWMLEDIPARANLVLLIDEVHKIVGVNLSHEK